MRALLGLLCLTVWHHELSAHAWEQFFKKGFKLSELEGMCLTEFENRIVYCEGHLIEAVNYHRVFNDSKTFVDRPLKKKPQEINDAFAKRFNVSDIAGINKDDLKEFVDEYFYEETSELNASLMECTPVDWKPNPPKIMAIQDPKLREWALELHAIWKNLCRTIKDDVKNNPDMHSILWVDEPFIVPGGRFQEFYYSDSYWIVKGLIISDMIETAKSITRNLASIVRRYGMIPNGGRVYYTNRSQPPLLAQMVYAIFEATNDIDYVTKMLPDLETELNWWNENRKFNITSQKNNEQSVYFYKTGTTLPRPESMWSDLEASAKLNKTQKLVFFESAASAAESGWDFSSRWFADQKTLSTMETINVAPVDLNSYLCGNMATMAYLFRQINDIEKAKFYENLYHEFIYVHEEVFYNQSVGGWYDFNIRTNQHRIHNYPSVATPLFSNCYSTLDENKPRRLFENLHNTGFFNFSGGVPASLVKDTNQQWDFPNGWAPLNHMLIEGLRQSSDPIMQDQGFAIATKWIYGNYKVYQKTQLMFEKYDVNQTNPEPGKGGEYDVVTGFGWTNGALLDLMYTYYDRIQAPPEENASSLMSCTFTFFTIVIFVFTKLLF